MQITDLIDPGRIKVGPEGLSKKRVLEQLGDILATGITGYTGGEIFTSLIERERLGSTGFGKGVAIPHSRVRGLPQPVAAFAKLAQGVDFDSVDEEPVDLLFALVVPEDSADEHLNLLSQLAQMLSDADLCRRIRNADDANKVYELLRNWEPERASA